MVLLVLVLVLVLAFWRWAEGGGARQATCLQGRLLVQWAVLAAALLLVALYACMGERRKGGKERGGR